MLSRKISALVVRMRSGEVKPVLMAMLNMPALFAASTSCGLSPTMMVRDGVVATCAAQGSVCAGRLDGDKGRRATASKGALRKKLRKFRSTEMGG